MTLIKVMPLNLLFNQQILNHMNKLNIQIKLRIKMLRMI